MKAMKKIFAFALAAIMVMAMGITVFATETTEPTETTPTITINGASEEAGFAYVQVIAPDTSKETGWAITNEAFKNAWGTDVEEQTILKAMINAVSAEPVYTDENGNAVSVDNYTETFIKALNAAILSISSQEGLESYFSEGNVIEIENKVKNAGVYAIMGYEEGYTYSVAAGYVSFKYATDGLLDGLESTTVTAKREPVGNDKIKDVEDDDHVTEIGKTVTYTVESEIPYFAADETERSYVFTDTLTGATFDINSITINVAGSAVKLQVGTEILDLRESSVLSSTFMEPAALAFVEMTEEGAEKLSIDLAALASIDSNYLANQTITITYKATVTGTQVKNDATIGDPSNTKEFGTGSVTMYTGYIELTKYAEEDKTVLEGAEFIMSKGSEDNIQYAKFNDLKDGKYQFDKWVTEKTEATKLKTDAKGKIVVTGLDVGTYDFEEVTAPEGYSINTEGTSATLSVAKDTVAEAAPVATTSLNDTKLAALPSTGGIGTTIFTICGVCIMVGAVSLFFVSRKRSAR